MSTNMTNATCHPHGRKFDHWWFRVLLTTVCMVGILGNILNLVVLTRHKMMRALDRLERSVSHLLVALALSDLGYCMVVLPGAFYSSDYNWYYYSQRFVGYYKVYTEHLQDVFMILSAWIIVILSVNRYIVVMHPLRAQSIVSGTCTAAGMCAVLLFGVVVTIPNFLYLAFKDCVNDSGEHVMGLTLGLPTDQWRILRHYKMRVWPVFATFLPFAIMTVCNIAVTVGLRRSAEIRRRSSSFRNVRSPSSFNIKKTTATLMSVVIMYLVLVVPIEGMLYTNIFRYHWGHLVGKVFTILVTLNFACNFLLYVMVYVKFRKIAISLLRMKFSTETKTRRLSISSTRTTSIMTRTSVDQQTSFALNVKILKIS